MRYGVLCEGRNETLILILEGPGVSHDSVNSYYIEMLVVCFYRTQSLLLFWRKSKCFYSWFAVCGEVFF